jgi:hypothetical protein
VTVSEGQRAVGALTHGPFSVFSFGGYITEAAVGALGHRRPFFHVVGSREVEIW